MNITCRNLRRGSAFAAAGLWVAAVVLTLFGGNDIELGWELLAVASAASATVMAGVGYILSRGSAEAVYNLGFQAGFAEGTAADETADVRGGRVLTLPVRYRG